jgi:hypothetical protein
MCILQHPHHNVAILKKDYEGQDLMVVYLWNFAHVERQPRKKKSSLKFSILFQIVRFISDF